MQRSTHTGLFKRTLVGVGAATALVGASLLGMPGISGADGVADLPLTDLGSANVGFDSGTISQPGGADEVITQLIGAGLLGSAAPQPAAGEGGMVGACHPVGAGGIYGSLFGLRENPYGYCTYPGLVDQIVGEELADVLAAGSADLFLRPAAGLPTGEENALIGYSSLDLRAWLRDPRAMLDQFVGGSLGSHGSSATDASSDAASGSTGSLDDAMFGSRGQIGSAGNASGSNSGGIGSTTQF